MRIANIKIENFGNIRKMVIAPNPERDVFSVVGQNGAGKTNLLDAINFLLPHQATGKRKEYDDVLNSSSDDGFVKAEIGDYVLERKFGKNGVRSVQVKRVDGQKIQGTPVQVIESLLGQYGLNVGRLITMDNEKLAKTFLEVFGLDSKLKTLKESEEKLYKERTDIGRDKAKLGEVKPLPKVDKVEVSALISELNLANKNNMEIDNLNNQVDQAQNAVSEAANRVDNLKLQLEAAEKSLKEKLETAEKLNDDLKGRVRVDIAEIQSKISKAETINNAALAYQNNVEKQKEVDKLESEYKEKSKQIDVVREQIKALFSDIEYPVDGLSFHPDQGLIYQGETRISKGNMIKVAFGLIASSNPDLKVVLIPDASLLDKSNREEIENLARDMGFQVFLEIVYTGQQEDDGTIMIESGEVVR